LGGGKTTKRLALAVAILTLIALLLSVLPFQPARANPDWWDPAWGCRKPITVTESSGATLTDYQVEINIGYATAMRPDFGDLRFTNASNLPLDYWLESKVDSASATVWVKVDSIAASADTTIYMYYDNSTASDASDGDATFEFFDDFSGTLSKWNVHIDTDVAINASYGSPAPCLEVSGGSMSGYPYGLAIIGSDATYTGFQNGIIEADIYPTANALPEIIFRGDYSANTGYKGRWDCRSGNETPWMKPPYGLWGGFGTAVPRFGIANQWQKAKLVINGSTFQIYSNDTFMSSVDAALYAPQYSGPGEIGLANHYGAWARFDNVRVRKYVSPEPTCNIGAEECNSAPDPPDSLGPAAYIDGRWVDDDTPTLNFTQSDPDGNTVSYTIQIDDTDNTFSSLVVDYTSELLAEGPASFTVGQAAGMGTYTAGGAGQTLNDGDYFWRVMSTDQHVVAGGWSVANGGAIAFRLNTATETGWTSKDIYSTRENVEVGGSGFPQNSNVDVYVVAEGEWLGGEAIAGYGIVATKNFATDGSGNFGPGAIWQSPLEVGEYDVVFDADCNGDYDKIPDFVDHPNHPGFTVVSSTVGGEVYPIDKTALLLPWLFLSAMLVLAAGITLALRRRQSR